jgi:AraC family transcriptional regulator
LRKLADTPDYSIADMLCTLGPRDPFREQELQGFRVCAVLSGSFGYRSTLGEGIAVAGSLLAGNACDCYRCRHFDDAGDRCVQFDFTGEFLERVRRGLGGSGLGERFARAVVPPSVESVALSAVSEAVADGRDDALEEAAFEVAAAALSAKCPAMHRRWRATASDERRVLRAVRFIEANSAVGCSLDRLSAEAGLSPYHFLRVFRRTTGQTPHRYVQATRLRQAAQRLTTTQDKIVDVAAAVGFGDLSNFNASFVRAFGRQPSVYRSDRLRKARLSLRCSLAKSRQGAFRGDVI